MINQSHEPATGSSKPRGQDWWKIGEIALGVLLILSGALSFIQVLTSVDIWHYFWPLILVALGVCILAERGGWFRSAS
jgi:hypothetical protein